MGWTAADISDLTGRTVIVTGATGGLGFEVSKMLASRGADVVLAARNARKGETAIDRIHSANPSARVRFELLDLASLNSVRAFSSRMLDKGNGIDILINNAGVMALPTLEVTVDGFERQMATNYLGHFLLTAELLPLLRQCPNSRVVNVSSLVAPRGKISVDDLQSSRSYSPRKTYATTKLAMLMFSREFNRRSTEFGWGVLGVAAHPGWARTDLVANGPGSSGRLGFAWKLAAKVAPFLAITAAEGSVPLLFAATSPTAVGGCYYGVTGLAELRGPLGKAKVPLQAKDRQVCASLWKASTDLTLAPW